MGWLWWFGLALILGVIEMLTLDLMFLMFAGGAAAAAVAGALGADLWVQVVVFAVVSVLLLVGVRPWAVRRLKASTPEAYTNIAAHIGRTATVLADVSDRAGRVKLAGEVWTARVEHQGVVLPVGSVVQVVRIEGATAVVEPEQVPNSPSQPYGTPGPGY
ncbi:MAG: NfeD family protein [Actinomycetales bacterium]|nr:NfeD family protein [Actinomycetales bacterium]